MTAANGEARRRALITGGASGFGYGVAEHMVAMGASVAIGDLDRDRLEDARVRLGEDVLALEMDVTSPASVRAAVDSCRQSFGGLDTLVNSAGVIRISPLADVTEADWDLVVDVDLKGTFLACQAAAPLLVESGRGRIVNIGSDASRVGFPNVAAYCAAKHGVIGLTKSIAGELASHGVTVNCVCPVGTPDTKMGQEVLDYKVNAMGKSTAEIMAATASNVPVGRNCTVEDVVNAIMFFISDESGFVTASALDVDGGMIGSQPVRGSR